MTADASLATLRRDLAAALRLADHFGLGEGICNHFSVAVPGEGEQERERYLINAYGWHWSEITPDRLLLIDGEGRVLEGHGEVEATARNIHIAGHRANPRHQAISSKLVKEIAVLGGDISKFVSPTIKDALLAKVGRG